MSIEQILKIEFPALSRTIREYTTDYYIVSYAEQIVNIDYPDDVDVLQILIEKLIGWYDNELTIILEGEYIYNKKAHQKSYELLLATQQLMKN